MEGEGGMSQSQQAGDRGCDQCTDYEDDNCDNFDDSVCPECNGDGRDKWCDYLLPCSLCQWEQRP
jgi:hypothetical protein